VHNELLRRDTREFLTLHDAVTTSRPALLWRSLPLRLVLAVIPAWFTLSILIFNVETPIKALVGFILALSIVSPAAGFLCALAVAPLGHLLAVIITDNNFRITEAAVLAFFAGWLLRGYADRRGPSVPRAIGWLTAGAMVASIVGSTWRLSRSPGELAREFDVIVHAYYFLPDRIGLVAGARIVAGIAMAAAAVTLFRGRPRLANELPAVLAGAGSLVAAASVLLWYGVAPAAILRQYAVNRYRVTAHVGDANAAGSYFAMLVCLTLGMVFYARGRDRTLWLAMCAANATALWLTASRSAVVAAALAVILAAAWIVSSRLKSRVQMVTISAIALVVIAIGTVPLWRSTASQLNRGTTFRVQFNATSWRMIAARPFVGVGIGQYYPTSPLFLTSELAWTYGSENAHNYFLQLGAEIGAPGFILFSAFIGAGLWRAMRALTVAPRDVRLLGVASGVGVFVATCFVGHPFLIDEVAIPFWAQFGLLLGLAGSTLDNHRLTAPERRSRAAPPWLLTAATVAVVLYLVAAVPIRASRRDIEPPASQAVDGFYGWESGAEGERYRWTERYASVFVPADVTHVDIPIRMPASVPGLKPVAVTLSINSRPGSTTLTTNTWTIVPVDVPAPQSPARFTRVNLRADHTWQPALYVPGSADFRFVGVQVGEVRMVRNH
jgi:O-antigen ligase